MNADVEIYVALDAGDTNVGRELPNGDYLWAGIDGDDDPDGPYTIALRRGNYYAASTIGRQALASEGARIVTLSRGVLASMLDRSL